MLININNYTVNPIEDVDEINNKLVYNVSNTGESETTVDTTRFKGGPLPLLHL